MINFDIIRNISPEQVNIEQQPLENSKNQLRYGIDVESYIKKYEVEALRDVPVKHPMLCYLLGFVQPFVDTVSGEQIRDGRPDLKDGATRPIWFLTEGSGMFGLKNSDDAMRWKGIFNHTIGSARYVEFVANTISQLTSEQKQQFIDRGYDKESLDTLNVQLLVDFMKALPHAGRRQVDERDWQKLSDASHPSGAFGDVRDSGALTTKHLEELHTPQELLDLMKVEKHSVELISLKKNNKFSDIRLAILTYCDWIFNQSLETLDARFAQLETSKRETPEILGALKEAGKKFEQDLFEITGLSWENIASVYLPEWEKEIREVYATSAGLSIQDVYPAFADSWEKQNALLKKVELQRTDH